METIKFSKEELLKMEKTAHRAALIENNLYSIPQHNIHKNKKKYNRKKLRNIKLSDYS